MDPSQKLATLKRTLRKNRQPECGPFTKIRDLKTDPKIKNYVMFQTRSVDYEFKKRKLLKNFMKLHFFYRKGKNFFTNFKPKFLNHFTVNMFLFVFL